MLRFALATILIFACGSTAEVLPDGAGSEDGPSRKVVRSGAAAFDAPPESPDPHSQLATAPPRLPIHTIQGRAHKSAYAGQAVVAQGIVTVVQSRAFYLQDPSPDADDATSEGILVYQGSSPGVSVGDAVVITATVNEYYPGGASSGNLSTTELTQPTIRVVTHGNALPAPTVIGLAGRVPPSLVIDDDATGNVETSSVFDPQSDGIDYYESLEGMLVRVDNAQVVGPSNVYGEVPVVADGGANASLLSARGGLVIREGDYNPERVILDDLPIHTPDLAVDDRIAYVLGVMDYNYGNYKLLASELGAVTPGGLGPEVTDLASQDELTIATFNLKNLSPRSKAARFAGLASQIVAHLGAPDIIGVQEIEDNSGVTDDAVVDASATYGKLIAAIQAAGGPAYAYRDIAPLNNADGGAPGANIRVGLLFRLDRATFIDRPGGDATTAASAVMGPDGPELSHSPGRVDPAHAAFVDNRKPLAGEFEFRGQVVFVVVCHSKSKNDDTALFGLAQPPLLVSETQRIQQAQVLHNFVASILALDPGAKVAILGDLNDWPFSASLSTLTGGILTNLVTTLPIEEQYSYIYDGNSEALDHILVTAGLLEVPWSFDIVHVNAEFPAARQWSDHDPEVARFCLDRALPWPTATPAPTKTPTPSRTSLYLPLMIR